MATATKIFVSATSSDLRSFRNQVKVWLLDMGWLPVVQDHFAPDDKTVIEMLRRRVGECDAVVHIVGRCYGAEPKTTLKGEPRRSYTQIEAALARKMRKRLFTVLLDECFPYDDHAPEADELQTLQKAYRLQVATGEHLFIPCRNPADLEPEIRKLRVEIDKLNKSRRLMALLTAVPLVAVVAVGGYLWHAQHTMQSDMGNQMGAMMEGQKRLEAMYKDAAGGGVASVQAIAQIRDILRPGRPDIDNVPPDKLPGLVNQILADLKIPAAKPGDFSGAVKQVLTEAQADANNLKFSEAADRLDKELAQADAEETDRTRGRAALLAERGRFARLQLRYPEAAGFYRKAAELVAGDPPTARIYLLAAADSLYTQGKEFGDNAALSDAIQSYGTLLATVSRDREPVDWAKLQNTLGNALEALGERESSTTRLEAAVAAYGKALEVRTREKAPLDWATTQNDLGQALERLGERESSTTRFEAAIQAYGAALDVRTQERTPLEWAATQNNLGNTQLRLGERDSGTTRLEGAVAAYIEALRVRTRERTPLEWAATENNLGLALQTLGERETGTARLEAAVAAYREALKVGTRERVPLDWAMTQNNLGLALERLGERETGTERLEAAVAAFTEALKERTRERVPLDWADTQNNLGLALQTLGERETGTVRLEAAITAYTEALKEDTREKAPLDWAMTQDNLGKALKTLGLREGGTARLEAAIAAYREALEENTREQAPLEWATTQNDLGNALEALGERESGTARLEAAIAAYSEALKVRTHESMPLDWAESIGDQGVAMMILAKRKGDAGMAKDALGKIEVALTTAQGGGDKANASYYSARLPEARALITQLAKPQ
jgi:tetratricopeptide (TPR) repeat protein